MVFITEDLIRRKSEHNNCQISTLEEISLHQLEIEKIEHLDKWCKELKILYLQSNLIPTIENVGKLKKLEYLNLTLNNISKIENLKGCESLNKLDLTVNFISEVTTVETLTSNMHLKELYLTGNPCTQYEGYREFVIATLPQLQFLDGKEIEKSERILAMQHYSTIRDDILQQQFKQYTSDILKKNNGKSGIDGDKYNDLEDTHLTEEEKEMRFWQEPTEYTPESRIEMHRHIEEKRRLKEDEQTARLDPNPPKRKIIYFTNDGKPLNINQAKMDFSLKECDDNNAFALEIPCYKHLDTSLIDVDVQPTYVRINVKGKVFQLVLSEEVSPDNSSAKRSQTTGNLLIKMPKVKQLMGSFLKKKKAKNRIDKDNNICNTKEVVKEDDKKKMEMLEVDDNAMTMVDIANIVKEEKQIRKTSPDHESFNLKHMERLSVNQQLQERNCQIDNIDFIDDPEVPPLM